MRTTYNFDTSFQFSRAKTAALQTPKRIVIHRQGNPGAKALASMQWGERENAFTIHRYIGGQTCYAPMELNRHAFHVLEPRIAEQRGFRVAGIYGRRGDYDSIGFECEDVKGGGPGQAYSLTQDTRITLLLAVAAILKAYPDLTVEDIDEHAAYDPWTRSEDLGDALYIPDFRADVQDYLDGREPWRTVQQYAYGRPAPDEWAPTTSTAVTTALGLLEQAEARIQDAKRLLGAK